LPGAGAVMAPRLLAAFGSRRDRYRSADELQTYSGIAPVTERSGKRKWVHFRWACFPSSCGKVFTNGPVTRLRNRFGPEPTINNNEIGAATTMQQYERWRSNGFAFYSVAGKIGSPMTKINTWRHLLSEARHWVSSS